MRTRSSCWTSALAALLLLPACAQEATVVGPGTSRVADAGRVAASEMAARPELATAAAMPVEAPFLLVFEDVNPCTGKTETFRFEGTSRTHLVGEHRIVHIDGTVTTSDGWTGKFNRQLVFHGTDVSTRRFFDVEVGPEGQRQLFTQVIHVTIVDGVLVTRINNLKIRCIGPSPE